MLPFNTFFKRRLLYIQNRFLNNIAKSFTRIRCKREFPRGEGAEYCTATRVSKRAGIKSHQKRQPSASMPACPVRFQRTRCPDGPLRSYHLSLKIAYCSEAFTGMQTFTNTITLISAVVNIVSFKSRRKYIQDG